MPSHHVLNSSRIRSCVLTGLALSVLCACAVAAPASAATSLPNQTSGNGITLSPPFKDITISSGLVSADANVTLTNKTGKDVNAELKVVDFNALGEFGAVSLSLPNAKPSKYGLAHWMHIKGGGSTLLPNGQATEVPISIDNSSDLTPGGHYGALVVTASAPSTTGSSKVSFRQELVSLFFVKKLGGERYGLKLDSFTAKKKLAVPDSATLRFAATGNVHVVPRGYVEVTDPNGRQVAKGTINPESSIIMPGTSRQLITLLEPTGSSKLVGRYSVTAYYRYDGQATFTKQTIYVNRWNIPIVPIILSILTGVILLLVLYKLYSSRKRFKNNKR